MSKEAQRRAEEQQVAAARQVQELFKDSCHDFKSKRFPVL